MLIFLFGLPSFFPSFFARRRPAFVRSDIFSRSSFARVDKTDMTISLKGPSERK